MRKLKSGFFWVTALESHHNIFLKMFSILQRYSCKYFWLLGNDTRKLRKQFLDDPIFCLQIIILYVCTNSPQLIFVFFFYIVLLVYLSQRKYKNTQGYQTAPQRRIKALKLNIYIQKSTINYKYIHRIMIWRQKMG